MENPALHKPFVQAAAKTQGVGWKTLSAQAKQPEDFQVYEPFKQKTKVYEKVPPHDNGPAQDFAHPPVTPPSSNVRTSVSTYIKAFNRIEAAELKSELQQKMDFLAYTLLGEPKHKTAREWRYGNHGSIAIHVQGTKQGLYSNFEIGSFGGPLKFIEDQLKIDYKEAYQWAIEWLGHKLERPYYEKPLQNTSTKEEQLWVPLYPVPLNKQNPDLTKEKSLSYVFTKQHHFEIARYPYWDAAGNLLGYTVRLENAQGDKIVLPLTYCQNPKGLKQWRWKGFGEERPLYGLQMLAEYPNKSVLIVEGEKTANAAKEYFEELVVISWPGGTGAVAKVDWSPLLGKTLFFWPDNDEVGHQAMEKIHQQLSELHLEKNLPLQAQFVTLPLETPAKWDLGDPLPPGWQPETIKQLLSLSSKPLETLFTAEYVKGVAQKYGIEEKHFTLNEEFQIQARALYQQMLQWHEVLEVAPTAEQKERLIEKAVLAEVLLEPAKNEYCFGSSHLSAERRGRDLALATANLMQQNPDKRYKIVPALDEANKRLTQEIDRETLIKQYQSQHPQASEQQVTLLVNQHYHCLNHIQLPLTEKAQHKILEAIKAFEVLQKQGNITKATHTIIQEQVFASSKETIKTVKPLLERHCIQQLVIKPENPQQSLNTAIKIVQTKQLHLEKQLQNSIELMKKDLNLMKEKEREH
jgi:hypothetical protein